AKPGTVKNIRSFQIFDRWGEMVFTQKDFQPNNPEIGWDGKLNGSELSPAVFVWYAEVEFIDGVIELYKGDVTLVR
ncbi:MAG: gliding motility-associated C-terminal domain-containing protein, partial [Bacteroidetes bacterium]|nr:gliding motility-associated C-terminal domain-containing protein [Bacteroidota bacterium]